MGRKGTPTPLCPPGAASSTWEGEIGCGVSSLHTHTRAHMHAHVHLTTSELAASVGRLHCLGLTSLERTGRLRIKWNCFFTFQSCYSAAVQVTERLDCGSLQDRRPLQDQAPRLPTENESRTGSRKTTPGTPGAWAAAVGDTAERRHHLPTGGGARKEPGTRSSVAT